MQEANELGKYVTDGKHTYPYNAYLDEMVKNGTLTFCDKPAVRTPVARAALKRLPITLTLEERTTLAEKLGVTVGEVGNMSPQELAEAEAELSARVVDGFPKD